MATSAAIEVLPRPRFSNTREELRAPQRGRLICAMADSVAAKGYAATSVADVLALAGVSRKTFYEHFGDKEDCFLAAYDHGAKATYEAMVSAAEGLTDWREMLDAVLTTWLDFLDADLSFPRAYMIELWAAGVAARARARHLHRQNRPGRRAAGLAGGGAAELLEDAGAPGALRLAAATSAARRGGHAQLRGAGDGPGQGPRAPVRRRPLLERRG